MLAGLTFLGCTGNGNDSFLGPPAQNDQIPEVILGDGTLTYATDVGQNPVIYVRMWKGEGAPDNLKPPELYKFAAEAARKGFFGIALLHYPNGEKPDEIIYLDGDEKDMGEVWNKRNRL